MLALVSPSYHLYHELILQDVKLDVPVTIIKKSFVTKKDCCNNKFIYDTYITTVDDKGITSYNEVERGEYESSIIGSKIMTQISNPKINLFLMMLAYMEYSLATLMILFMWMNK